MPGNRTTHHHRAGASIPSRPFATPKPKRAHRSDIAPELREAVYARARGLCELCGERLDQPWQAHHRKLKSRGGQDSVSNLAALHPLCHRRVHGHVTWATEAGFLVPSQQDPSRARMALHGETWVLLRVDGTYGVLGGGR